MRLRVRDASDGRTWRVQLDQISPTFEDLENAVIYQCSSSGEDTSNGVPNMVLSLNKKDPIHNDPAATLNSIGLCNGDLVWILSGAPTAASPMETQPPTSTPETMTKIAANSIVAPGTSQEQEQPDLMDVDPNQDPSPSSSQEVDESDSYFSVPFPVPVGLRIPGYLLRVLSSYAHDSSFLEMGPTGVLVLMAHAAMLETGFTYIDYNESIETAEAPSPSAPAAAPSTSNQDNDKNSQYCLSRVTTAISSGVYRLTYSFGIAEFNREEQQQDKIAPPPPSCTLLCSAMGDSVLIAASAQDGKHARHVVLDWKAQGYVVPYDVGTSDATKEKYKAVASGSKEGQKGEETTESLLLCEYVEITSRQDIILIQNYQGERGPRQWKISHGVLGKVWNILKDSLALPMLTAACLSAGYPPPAGLLTLPTEVKTSLLSMLDAIDLAALGATSTELRHLTSTDELWKPLFIADFPNPPVEIAEAVPRKGYKWAYAHCFIERSRLEEERRRRRHRRYVIPGLPHLGPRPPYYPAGAPRGFPGIIGGDQDRLPFFPGPPGRFTFGGASGSGGGHRWV